MTPIQRIAVPSDRNILSLLILRGCLRHRPSRIVCPPLNYSFS